MGALKRRHAEPLRPPGYARIVAEFRAVHDREPTLAEVRIRLRMREMLARRE